MKRNNLISILRGLYGLLLIAGPAFCASPALQADSIFDALVEITTADSSSSVNAVYCDQTGSVWVACESREVVSNNGVLAGRGWRVFVRRLDLRGHAQGRDVKLGRKFSWGNLPLGFRAFGANPAGEFIFGYEIGSGWTNPRYCLVRVTKAGEVVDSCDPGVEFAGRNVFIGPDGVLHFVTTGFLRRSEYVQFDAARGGFSRLRSIGLDTTGPDGSMLHERRWARRSRGLRDWAVLPEAGHRLLVALTGPDPQSTPVISVYRFNDTTLAVLDSTPALVRENAARVIEGFRVESMQLVRTSAGGYWLYTPDLWDRKAAQTLVFRLDEELEAHLPSQCETLQVQVSSVLPRDGRLNIEVWNTWGRQYAAAGWPDATPNRTWFSFTACTSDGRVVHYEREWSWRTRVGRY